MTPAADRGSTASPISLDEAPTGLQRQVLMTRPSLTLRTADVQARSAELRTLTPAPTSLSVVAPPPSQNACGAADDSRIYVMAAGAGM